MTAISMLSRVFRLPSSEFLARGYRTVRTPYFSLKAKPNGLPKNRIGVIISVAAVKKATKRNFWKRQVKTAYSRWHTTKGFDFLLVFSKQGEFLRRAEFQVELQKAFSLLLGGMSSG